jgi:hypothetical protein
VYSSSGSVSRIYRNNGGNSFTEQPGAGLTGLNYSSVAWGDYDNDGFLDLFVAQPAGKNVLYHNLGNTNHWIKFKLEGVVSNRSAIGAKVRVWATIGGKSFWQMRELSANHISQSDPRPEFLQELKKSLGSKGSIIAYNSGYEEGVLQDLVEESLIEDGYARVAKAYILYRQKRAEIRKEKRFVNSLAFVEDREND